MNEERLIGSCGGRESRLGGGRGGEREAVKWRLIGEYGGRVGVMGVVGEEGEGGRGGKEMEGGRKMMGGMVIGRYLTRRGRGNTLLLLQHT